MSSKYAVVSGTVFGIVAVAQAFRAFNQFTAQVGNFTIPVWASWVAAAFAGSLCLWAFRSRH